MLSSTFNSKPPQNLTLSCLPFSTRRFRGSCSWFRSRSRLRTGWFVILARVDQHYRVVRFQAQFLQNLLRAFSLGRREEQYYFD